MLVDEDIRVVKTEVELNGPERFAADQMVTKKECEILIKLANVRLLYQEYFLSSFIHIMPQCLFIK